MLINKKVYLLFFFVIVFPLQNNNSYFIYLFNNAYMCLASHTAITVTTLILFKNFINLSLNQAHYKFIRK